MKARYPILLPLLLVTLSGVAQEASLEKKTSHSDLMRRAILSAAAQEWPRALMTVDQALKDEELLDELQVAEAHYMRGWLFAQPRVFETLMEAQAAAAAQAVQAGDEEPPNPLSTTRPYHLPIGDFDQTRTLAGPNDLRSRAIYNLGCVHLFDGEDWRSQIPEIAGANGQAQANMPGMPGASGAPGNGGAASEEEQPPDPLEEARKSYSRSMSWLLERLKLDWRDEDTRANLELIQRRLRELDEIEKQREQEQQDQQDQQDQQEGDEDQDGEPQENEDQEGEQQESDENQEGDPEDQEPGDQEQEEPKPGEGDKEQEQEQQQPEEGQEQEQQAPQPHEGNPENAERHMTREEVMRLLDKLSQMEEEYRQFQEAMRAARRIPVERDW